MKNNKLFLVAAIVAVLLVFGILSFWKGSNVTKEASPVSVIDASLLIKPHNLVKGSADAKVVIVEFLDPECEACRAMQPILNSLMSEYEGKVKLVIRYMPFHGNSKLAAVMLEEAREQGKFTEALNILFDKQPEWADHARPRPELLPELLTQVGVKESTLQPSDLITKHGWKIDLDQADGVKAGVRHTPTFFVNGQILGEIGYAPLKAAIEIEMSR